MTAPVPARHTLRAAGVVAALASTLATRPAAAQRLGVAVWGGAGATRAANASGPRTGPLGALALDLAPEGRRWAVRVDAALHTASRHASPGGEVTGDVQTPQLGIGLRLAARDPRATVVPYAAAALTVARPSTRLTVHETYAGVTSPTFEQVTHETAFGAYQALGTTVRLARGLRAFGELRGQIHNTTGTPTLLSVITGLAVPLDRRAR